MRVPILVLALVATPFIASVSQDRAKPAPNVKSVASVKKSDVQSTDVQQQGQHNDEKCEKGEKGKKGEKEKSKRGQSQNDEKGQHKNGDESCAGTPTPPPPAPVGNAEIHGTVFNDANKNGLMDWNEYGLAGWTVTLTGPVTATTTTNGMGAYAFTALPVGVYTVCEVLQVGWIQTAPTTGPTCSGSIGWRLDIPVSVTSTWFSMIDFGNFR